VKKSRARSGDDELESMFHHPGFLIRRAQQIAVDSFLQHYGSFGVTPTQSLVLKLVRHRPGLDQVGVGRVLGLDRTTAATVVNGLAADKLIERRSDPDDRRRKVLFVTAAGTRLLERIRGTDESRDELLSVFEKDEAATFLALLEKFVTAFNSRTRIPMEGLADAPPATSTRIPPPKKKRAAG